MTYWLETVVSRAKRRWFVYPGSDIYGWLANSWDYGPYGSLLRKNILDARWKFFVQQQENIVWIEWAMLMHPKVWEASGHVETFNDPLIDDKKTGERFRADKIIEDKIAIIVEKVWEKWALQALEKVYGVNSLNAGWWTMDQMKAFIDDEIPHNPNTKKDADWTDVRKFNLMLSTNLGVIADDSTKVWLRPETAQTMFVDYKNIIDTMRVKVPFGVAQVGKVFRNEITPGNFLFRTREFEQMEIQMFLHPDMSDEWFDEFFAMSWHYWLELIWLKKENLRLRDHDEDELAHYCAKARDFEYNFPRWWWELQWIHDRTDFDLKQHQEHSGKDMQYHDPITGKRYVPHVVELSMGLSRTIATAMIDAYEEEQYTDWNGNEQTRVVARFHKNIAPIKFAILPLIKKDEKQVKIARDIFKKLSENYMCEYDDGWAIGKRYRRQDEIGTPYCITVDHQTVEDGTVTIRERDTMEQRRINIEEISL